MIYLIKKLNNYQEQEENSMLVKENLINKLIF
jgi:hypothetical protein